MMNLNVLRPTVAGILLCTLTACGGSSDSDAALVDVVVPTSVDTTTVDTSTTGQRASATALLETWAPTTPVYTALSAIPTTGGADYTGYVFGELSNGSDDITDSVIGSLILEADFNVGGATFTGRATDFVDDGDVPLTGSLTINDGTLDRTGNPAEDATVRDVNVAGTLTDDAGRDLVFGFQLEGDFLGGAYNAIGGEALGSVTADGVDQNFDGGFIAEQ